MVVLELEPVALVRENGIHYLCTKDAICICVSGRVWSKNPNTHENWEIEVVFRISGRGRVGADGLVTIFVIRIYIKRTFNHCKCPRTNLQPSNVTLTLFIDILNADLLLNYRQFGTRSSPELKVLYLEAMTCGRVLASSLTLSTTTAR